MTWVLEPGSVAPAQARWHMAELFEGAALADAELVASELVTNAWKHGEGPIEVSVDDEAGVWRIQVCSDSDSDPAISTPSLSGGRGLLLIEELTVEWGFTRSARTVCVWATLRVA